MISGYPYWGSSVWHSRRSVTGKPRVFCFRPAECNAEPPFTDLTDLPKGGCTRHANFALGTNHASPYTDTLQDKTMTKLDGTK